MAAQRTFLYEELKEILRSKVEDGTFGIGSRVPSIPQLSTQYNVSDITVRRALADLEQEGVLVRRHGSGTFVSDANSNGGNNSRLIGVAVRELHSITHNYMLQVIAGVSSVASRANYHVDFSNTASRESESHFLRAIRSKNPIRLIVIDQYFTFEDGIYLKQAGVPYVLVDEIIPGLNANVVFLDLAHGTKDACQHLINKGHRRVAIILRTLELSDDYRRLQGLRQAMEANQLPVDEQLVVSRKSLMSRPHHVGERVAEIIEDLLALTDPPTAFVFPTDTAAIEAVHILAGRGRNAPEDVAVVGYNDVSAETLERPRLTKVAGDFTELGRKAAERLLDIAFDENPKEQSLSLKCKLIEQETA